MLHRFAKSAKWLEDFSALQNKNFFDVQDFYELTVYEVIFSLSGLLSFY